MKRTKRSGFTLVETVVSLGAMAAILMGLASAMLVSSRIAPAGDDRTSRTIAAAEAMDDLMRDLEFATSVSMANPSGVRFKVADRNNDGQEEQIQYLWTGVAGQPLYRITNGGTPEAILPEVRQFSMTFHVDNAGGEVHIRAAWASLWMHRESTWIHHGVRMQKAPGYVP